MSSAAPIVSTPKATCKPPRGLRGRWCSGLAAILSGTFGRGVFVVDIHNFKTRKSRIIGVASRIGATHTGAPLMFNRCPFCGESILFTAAEKRSAR